MPIRDYQCRDCQHEFESLDKGGPKRKCPKCSGRLDVVFKQMPAYHNRYSLMHPQRREGRVKG